MKHDDRFKQAIERFDAANGEDPQLVMVDGKSRPKELMFNRRVYEWMEKLVDNPSEALLLAARSHTMKRWEIPRDTYPMTTVGYHKWRDDCAAHHAKEAANILRKLGYENQIIDQVEAFILKRNWPQDGEACALEDADCLVFLETKLQDYTDEWDEKKMQRILQRTLRKMTPDAQSRAAQLTLGDREREALLEAVRQHDAGSPG